MGGVRVAEREGGASTCAYCRDLTGADATSCSGCGALYHAPCLTELGRCATIGCDAGPPAASAPAVAPGGAAPAPLERPRSRREEEARRREARRRRRRRRRRRGRPPRGDRRGAEAGRFERARWWALLAGGCVQAALWLALLGSAAPPGRAPTWAFALFLAACLPTMADAVARWRIDEQKHAERALGVVFGSLLPGAGLAYFLLWGRRPHPEPPAA